MKKLLLPLMALALMPACGKEWQPQPYTLSVAGHTEPCTSSGHRSKPCLLVRENSSQAWGFNSAVKGFEDGIPVDWIRGFQYEPGYVYSINLQSQKLCSFDGCTYELTLIKLNSKVAE